MANATTTRLLPLVLIAIAVLIAGCSGATAQASRCNTCASVRQPVPMQCGEDQISTVAVANNIAKTNPGLEAIYGRDSRVDYYTVAGNGAIGRLAKATVALVDSPRLAKDANGYAIDKEKVSCLAVTQPLCDGERFCDQDGLAFCSGTLITSSNRHYVLTAAHCFKRFSTGTGARKLEDTLFVFGWRIAKSNGAQPLRFDARQVYRAAKVGDQGTLHIGRQSATNPYWVMVQIDGLVDSDVASPLRSTDVSRDPAKAGDEIFVLGYPSGIPLKYADNSQVKLGSDSESTLFQANLDTFHGNSGGGVYRKSDAKLVGLLDGGRDDYKPPTPKSVCKRACVFEDKSKQQETVTRISGFELP